MAGLKTDGKVRILATGEVTNVLKWLDDGCVVFIDKRGIGMLQDWEYEVIERR